jgi:hypothetical protein
MVQYLLNGIVVGYFIAMAVMAWVVVVEWQK